MLFRYNLLCDECNWEFKGFAVPGTVSVKPKSRKRKTNTERTASAEDARDKTFPNQASLGEVEKN
jgi:hypothetical protein